MEKISIHALREEGDRRTNRENAFHHISIHALREEGDFVDNVGNGGWKAHISIHALREEGDQT